MYVLSPPFSQAVDTDLFVIHTYIYGNTLCHLRHQRMSYLAATSFNDVSISFLREGRISGEEPSESHILAECSPSISTVDLPA